jgi:predicted NUDIX family phosphoesterase
MSERIMVVPREAVLNRLRYYAAIPIEPQGVAQEVFANALAKPRDEVENDEEYLQVIPYVVLHLDEHIIGARRLSGGGEARLHDRYLAGFGGHVRWPEAEDDAHPQNLFVRSVRQELLEEIGYGAEVAVPEPTHLLVDDTTEVGRVHLGLLVTMPLQHLLPKGVSPTTLVSREPEKLELFVLGRQFQRDHGEKLEGWARLALSVLWG